MSDISEPAIARPRRRRPGGSVPWIWVAPGRRRGARVPVRRDRRRHVVRVHRLGRHQPHATWVGLDNFREILDDPASRGALKNTLKLAFSFVDRRRT